MTETSGALGLGTKGTSMARHASSVLAGIGLAALLAGGLAGCATGAAVDPSAGGSDAPSTAVSDAPSADATEIEVEAAWLDGGRMIGLVTEGSSTCLPLVQDAGLEADGTLAVVLAEADASQACTRDLVPRVTLVALPEGVDPAKDLEISVSGEGYYGDADLDGVPGLDPALGAGEYSPSAGWTDEDGMFVVLTWGSSSCPEVVESAEATGADAVTVTFAAAPEDQVCTMDMGPRGAVAFVDGLEDRADVALTLTGATFPEATTVILGEN